MLTIFKALHTQKVSLTLEELMLYIICKIQHFRNTFLVMFRQ